ncbi:pyridoxal kinase-like protein, partial [Cladochytrium replicatum]
LQSVSSHVVFGYVGNKAITFPLQLLGFDVCSINTVQFSNHTGYPVFTGERLEGPQIRSLIDGLEKNGIVSTVTHLLTGYVGRPSSLLALADLAKTLREKNERFCFILDPVMGDNNKLYVGADVVPIYRDILLPLAHLITPNAFEVETLTGVSISTIGNVHKALDILHSKGVPVIVITSTELDELSVSPQSSGIPDHLISGALHLIASVRTTDLTSPPKSSQLRFRISFPKLKAGFTGTGDLFSALTLARLQSQWDAAPDEWEADTDRALEASVVARACELAVASMQAVLARTMNAFVGAGHVLDDAPTETKERSLRMADMELNLVEGKREIESPVVEHKAVRL